MRRGASILDIAGLAFEVQASLPTDWAAVLEKVALRDLQTVTSGDHSVLTGELVAPGEVFIVKAAGFAVTLSDVAVRLSTRRAAPASPVPDPAGPDVDVTLRDTPDEIVIDLLARDISAPVPGLTPALRRGGEGSEPLHLIPDPDTSQVRLKGSAGLRLRWVRGAGWQAPGFVDGADPLAPLADLGMLAEVRFEPASFFIAGSAFGLTCRRVRMDTSEVASPPEVIARGQTRDWRGLLIEEFDLFPPRGLPCLGDVSLGVRDVLLAFPGSPGGVQGEAHLEFGRSATDPATLTFRQTAREQHSTLTAQSGGKGLNVTLANDANDPADTFGARPAQVRAHGADGKWTLPDGTTVTGTATPWFPVRAGQTLVFQGREVVGAGDDATEVLRDKTPILFEEAGAAQPAAPRIDVTPPGQGTALGVIAISATLADLEGLVFEAARNTPPALTDPVWTLAPRADTPGPEPEPLARGTDPTFTWPAGLTARGELDLTLTDATGQVRRLRIYVVDRGEALISSAADGPVPARIRTYSGDPRQPDLRRDAKALSTWHVSGRFGPFRGRGTPTLSPLQMPPDSLMQVAWDLTPPPPPGPATETLKTVILMEYDQTALRGFLGDPVPGPTSTPTDAQVVARLTDWLKAHEPAPGATIYVIGQTSPEGSDTHNAALGLRRAERARALLDKAIAATDFKNVTIRERAETTAGTRLPDEPAAPAPVYPGQPTLTRPTGGVRSTFALTTEAPFKGKPTSHEVYRNERNASILVTHARRKGADPKPPEEIVREILVAGADEAVRLPSGPDAGDLPYRVRARAVWDSPRVVDSADWIPTLTEIEVGWQTKALPLPGNAGTVTPKQDVQPAPDRPDELVAKLRASFDRQTGLTGITGSLDGSRADKGLFTFSDNSTANNVLAATMALAPPLAAGLSGDDLLGSGARLGALLLAGIAGATVVENGKLRVTKITIDGTFYGVEKLDESVWKLLLDYEVELGIKDDNALGLTTSKPIKVKYKSVGFKIDVGKLSSDDPGVDKWGAVSLMFDSAKFELVSSGSWQITNPLGKMLQIKDVQVGTGSMWIEIDLAFTLDSGVVKVSGAKVRLTLTRDGPRVELRGLAASVEVPGVVRGTGALSLLDGGGISARIEADIIPAGAKAGLGIVIHPQPGGWTHVALGANVGFATPIPLASTGLGINGFMGEFAAHGARNLGDPPNPDVVKRELGWYAKQVGGPGAGKYKPAKDQWALGLGIVTGTLPDAGFSLNLEGMVGVAFPDWEVLLGVAAKFLDTPPGVKASKDATQAALQGLVVLSEEAVTVAIKGQYTIPAVLDLKIPVGAHFPTPRVQGPFFIRIGADNEGPAGRKRHGDPISATILPGSLEQTASCFLMFEERELMRLGGNDALNFQGFSIGMGAAWGIDYRAGPFRLSAEAGVLVGLGLRPVAIGGMIRVSGKLDLGVVAVGASGELTAFVSENPNGGDPIYLIEGKFCGRVKLFFFTLKGCVGVTYRNDGDTTPPPVPSPVDRLALCDRRGRIVQEVLPGGSAAAPVWPDTVPTLKFAPAPGAQLGGSAQFALREGVQSAEWSGTGTMQMAYRITGLRLRERNGPDVAPPPGARLEAAWIWPTHRPPAPDVAAGDPAASRDEGRDLALLDWRPAPWAHNLGSNADPDHPGNPGRVIERICDPITPPDPACLYPGTMTTTPQDGLEGAAIARADHPAEGWRATLAMGAGPHGHAVWKRLANRAPLRFVGAMRVPLTLPANPPDPAITVTEALRLPVVMMGPEPLFSLKADIAPSPAILRPELTLRLPAKRKQPTRKRCIQPVTAQTAQPVKVPLRAGAAEFEPLAGNAPYQVLFLGVPTLGFAPKGVRITPTAPARRATLTLRHGTTVPVSVSVEVIGTDGSRKSFAVQPIDGRSVTTLIPEKENARIARLEITGGGFEEGVEEVCFDIDTAEARGMSNGLDEGWGLDPMGPVVVGTTAQGATHRWQAVAVLSDGGRMAYLRRYRPPAAQGDAVWTNVRVLPLMSGWVEVISLCGLNATTAREAARASRAKRETVKHLDAPRPAPAGGGPGAWPDGETRPILKPGTEYELEVTWAAARWIKKDHGGDTPPALETVPDMPQADMPTWSDAGGTARFGFTTAALAAAPPALRLGAAEMVQEDRFRPADVARYLSGLEPDGIRAPHFRDDPLFAHFEVAYPRQLLQAYGHDLRLAFRRTDPAPGGGVQPLEPPVMVHAGPLRDDLLPQAVGAMVEAARGADCIDSYAPGGQTVAIRANLLAEAFYDLLLFAPPLADPLEETHLVGRAHFRASRYRDAVDLLAELGLESGPGNPIAPRDALVQPDLPLDGAGRFRLPGRDAATFGTDAGLEAALRAFGLDPWPLSPGARITPIRSGRPGDWHLLGVLVEAPEPLRRSATLDMGDRFETGTRLAPGTAAIHDDTGTHALRLTAANGGWTRLILTPERPLSLRGAPRLEMTLDQGGGTRGAAQGGAASVWTPRAPVRGRIALRPVPYQAMVEGFA